ncbi:uncharacterized protein LOC144324519 [Canis aureus]
MTREQSSDLCPHPSSAICWLCGLEEVPSLVLQGLGSSGTPRELFEEWLIRPPLHLCSVSSYQPGLRHLGFDRTPVVILLSLKPADHPGASSVPGHWTAHSSSVQRPLWSTPSVPGAGTVQMIRPTLPPKSQKDKALFWSLETKQGIEREDACLELRLPAGRERAWERDPPCTAECEARQGPGGGALKYHEPHRKWVPMPVLPLLPNPRPAPEASASKPERRRACASTGPEVGKRGPQEEPP